MTTLLLPTSTLFALASRGLAEARGTSEALRVAAAVLACRARPLTAPVRRAGPTSAWVLLRAVAPELGEWADFFAAGARKRAAAEAGRPGAVTPREADDLLRDAERFLAVAEETVGPDGNQLALPRARLLASG